LWIAALLTGGFMFVEFFGGLYAHSLALMADAAHMLTDAGALGLALFALRWSRKNADEHRPYGYGRLQVLAAFINGLTVLGLASFIYLQAAWRFWSPKPVDDFAMLWVAVVGLVVNMVVFGVLNLADRKNVNIRAAALHVSLDMLSSVGVIISALLISWTGWDILDPIASLIVATFVAKSAKSIVKETGHILLEGKPRGLDLAEVSAVIRAAVPEVENAHKMHAWSLSGEDTLLTLHLAVADTADTDHVLRTVKKLLADRFSIHHTTIQLECNGCVDVVKLAG